MRLFTMHALNCWPKSLGIGANVVLARFVYQFTGATASITFTAEQLANSYETDCSVQDSDLARIQCYKLREST